MHLARATRLRCGLATSAIAAFVAVVPGNAAASADQDHCDLSRPAVSYQPGGRTTHVDAAKRRVPCRYDTGARSLEPSLDFTRDGRIVFQAWELQPGMPDGAPPEPKVVRSDKSFSSWQDVSPPGAVVSLDPYLTVDHRTGRIFSVNFIAGGSPACAMISHSDDNGDSWISSPAACGGFDGESIGAGPAVTSEPIGYRDLVYYCTGTTPGSSPPATTPICSKSLDGGLTFTPTGSPPWPVYEEDAEEDEFGPWAGNPIVGADGSVYVPKRFAGQPEVAISRDEGLSWKRVLVARNGAGGATPRMAEDGRGNLFFAWVGADHLPYLAYSRTKGKTWSAPIALKPPGLREAALPRPAATGDGRVAVAYIGSTDSPGKPPFYAYCDVLLSPCTDENYAGVTWNGYMTLLDNAFATRPTLQTATVDPPTRPLLVGGCSADGACKADLDFIDVAFGPDGDPFAAFVDDCKLERDFIPVFGQDFRACGDNLGEGIVGRLTRAN